MLFAGLSGDWNPMHTDAEYARQAMFGERVAHGLLGLSIASGLAMQTGFLNHTVEAFTGLDWKFRAPIKIGDTIFVEAEVKEKKLAPGGAAGFVEFNVAVKNQRGGQFGFGLGHPHRRGADDRHPYSGRSLWTRH